MNQWETWEMFLAHGSSSCHEISQKGQRTDVEQSVPEQSVPEQCCLLCIIWVYQCKWRAQAQRIQRIKGMLLIISATQTCLY